MDIFIQIIGYLGAIGIAIFSCPELIKCFKTKRTSSINVYLFILLMFSSACFFISGFYNIAKNIQENRGLDAFALAVAIANVFSFIVPSILLSYKLYNKLMAKKLKISEKEYEDKKILEAELKKKK